MPSAHMEATTPEEPRTRRRNLVVTRFAPVALAERLRKGTAAFVIDVIFLYRLLRHSETGWLARGLLFFPVIYLCSPIQLIPNFIPVLGQMDDVFVIWITKKIARNLVDEKTWQECLGAAASTIPSFLQANAVPQDDIQRTATVTI